MKLRCATHRQKHVTVSSRSSGRKMLLVKCPFASPEIVEYLIVSPATDAGDEFLALIRFVRTLDVHIAQLSVDDWASADPKLTKLIKGEWSQVCFFELGLQCRCWCARFLLCSPFVTAAKGISWGKEFSIDPSSAARVCMWKPLKCRAMEKSRWENQ